MAETIRIIVKSQVCSGCLSCTTTCSMVNEHFVSLAAARVRVELKPFGGTHKIVICRQCANALCAKACPEHAITETSSGAWIIDENLCNGCKKCIEACPFHAIFWNPFSERVIKCELCDGDPQCVQACPTGSLTVQQVLAKETQPDCEKES